MATIANAMTGALGYVYGYGATELDYCAGLYYDPAVYSRFVEGNYQSENFRLLADGYSEGYADWYPAEVGFRYTRPIGNEYYNTDSVHYVIDYYYGGRRVVARTYHTIRFPPPADECQQGQSFAPNGDACPTPSPSPSPSPSSTPESITLIVDAGPDAYIRPAETGDISTAPVTVRVSPAATRTVDIALSVYAGSGGHEDAQHVGGNAERPKGTIGNERTTLRGTTDASGVFRTTYQASVFASRVKITATSGSLSTDAILDVKVPNLQELFGGENYTLTGGTLPHPAAVNHWGTDAANNALRSIANDYKAEYYPNQPIPNNRRLLFNDQSLPQGGKFEIEALPATPARWRTVGSHAEHRVGINCDVSFNDVPVERRRRLLEIFDDRGSTDTHPEPARNHWHLRFEFGQNLSNGFASARDNYVPDVFWGALDREPSDGEWQEWMSRLEAAQSQGMAQTLAEAKVLVRTQFHSAEYASRSRSDESYVYDLFLGYWRREPTAEEQSQRLNQLQSDNAQGLNGRENVRQSFENSPEFTSVVGNLEGTYEPPTCDSVQEQDCYNNGGSWNFSTCSCNYNPDPCWNGSYYICE